MPSFQPIFLGQFLSLCITLCNLSTSALVEFYKFKNPSLQTLLNYLLLSLVYLPLLLRRNDTNLLLEFKKEGWKFALLALLDFEANYFIIKGFGLTSYLSAMLINACSTPAVAILSISLALLGLITLISQDVINNEGKDRLSGDFYCVLGALLYACSNTLEEKLISGHSRIFILSLMGLFGLLINFFQCLILEPAPFTLPKEDQAFSLLVLFNLALFSLYSLVPVLIQSSGATFYNLSLLTADFYGLLLGLLFLPIKMSSIYPLAFGMILIGCTIFHLNEVEKSGQIEELSLLDR